MLIYVPVLGPLEAGAQFLDWPVGVIALAAQHLHGEIDRDAAVLVSGNVVSRGILVILQAASQPLHEPPGAFFTQKTLYACVCPRVCHLTKCC